MEKSVLKDLVMLPSPSGFEFMAENYIRSLEFTKEYIFEKDNIGNLYFWHRRSEEEETLPTEKVMISAHLDEIGLTILSKTSDNLYRVGEIGGIDRKVLEGQRVWCYPDPIGNPKKVLKGVIGKTPIHLEKRKERDKVEEIEDIMVDFGELPFADEPGIGSPIVIEKHFTDLPGGLFAAPGLDDKAGIWVVLDLMDRLKDTELSCDLVFVLMAQEETGLRGATIAARRVNPTVSIDLDVSFALDEGRPETYLPKETIKLGDGPILVYGPDKDYGLMKELKSLAPRVQESVSVSGGTNTWTIQLNSDDCKTALVSIPQRNMHTPVEVCAWKDLEACSDMIFNYIK